MYVTTRRTEELKKVCMEPERVEGSISYYVIHSPGRNITILNPIFLGREFNKTFGHYHTPRYPEKYLLLYGMGAVLMQKPKNLGNYYEGVSEISLVRLEEGREFEIPAGFGHTLINFGPNLLIVKDNWDSKNAKHDYVPIERKRGFGYYIIKGESGNVKYVKNKTYKNLPKIKLVGF